MGQQGGIDPDHDRSGQRCDQTAPAVEQLDVNAAGRADEDVLHDIVSRMYAVESDDAALRRTVGMTPAERGNEFDRLRREYPRRREFHTTRVRLAGGSDALRAKAAGLGFHVE